MAAVLTTTLLMLGVSSLTADASAAGGADLAAGRPATASSAHAEYAARNITDGDQGTYWQSAGGGLPQWVQADLGSTARVDEVVLKLPASWESRSQTLSVQGSADGTAFSTLKASAAYTFAPGSANTVTVAFPAGQARFVRVEITANTGWQAAQLSELQVHAAGESSTDLAHGRPFTASSHTETHVPADAADGDKASHWESRNNEHMVCLYWGADTDRITLSNARIRDTFADGVNMTNGSTDNHVVNNESRSTGDDSFALFSAIDAGGADVKDNLYENLTSLLTWRAAGIAVYGGHDNTFRNIHIADTLVYSGITISSLDFGYPMNGFGTAPTTVQNVSVVRSGGHFWGAQTFPGIWLFSASKVFQGIRIDDVDIVDPTYSGIMFQTQYVDGRPVNPIKDTVLTDISVTGARRSGDAFDARSGFGLWANELPEPGQGPAVGEVTFNGLRLNGNAVDIRNTTSTFKININPRPTARKRAIDPDGNRTS